MRAFRVFSVFFALAVAGLLPVSLGQAQALPQATPPDPQQIFAENCAACHGEAGEGRVGPALTHLDDHSDEELIQVITEGRPEKGMPPWGSQLSSEEIAALVAYLRTLGGGEETGHEEEQPSSVSTAAGTLSFVLSLEGKEVVARASLEDPEGGPLVGQEVSFNLLTVLGGILPLGTAVTNGEGVAEFRYDPGEAPAIRMEAVYQPSEDQLPVEVDSSLELPGGEEIPPVEPGLYSAVPPLFAVVLLATVIGAVWLTYAWVGWQLLQIWLARGHNQEGRI